jgi:GTPase SAR1 family protein
MSARRVKVSETEAIKLDIWDLTTMGVAIVHSISWFRNVHVFFLCYNVTSKKTFDNMTQMIDMMQQYGREHQVVVVLGCQVDRRKEAREVTMQEGRSFADTRGYLFFECSALNGEGCEEAVNAAAAEVASKIREGLLEPAHLPRTAFHLPDEPPSSHTLCQC